MIKNEKKLGSPIILYAKNNTNKIIKDYVLLDTRDIYLNRKNRPDVLDGLTYKDLLLSLIGNNIKIGLVYIVCNKDKQAKCTYTFKSTLHSGAWYKNNLVFKILPNQVHKNIADAKFDFEIENLFSITVDKFYPKTAFQFRLYIKK